MPEREMTVASDNGVAWQDVGLLAKKTGTSKAAFGHVTPFLLLDAEKEVHYLYVGAAKAATWDRNQIAVIPLTQKELSRFVKEER